MYDKVQSASKRYKKDETPTHKGLAYAILEFAKIRKRALLKSGKHSLMKEVASESFLRSIDFFS